MSDTIIPRSYYSDLLPGFRSDHTVFWMTDANINEQQMALLASANIRVILPGIESFHNDALRLLNKSNSAVGNVAMLKYAMENGIAVRWHFLFGIPGENPEWYKEMADWLPLVSHLQPPAGMWRLRYDRFSAYFRNSQEYGLKLVPIRSYKLVYPISDEDMQDLAYFFDDETKLQETTCNEPPMTAMQTAMFKWQGLFFRFDDKEKRSVLSYREEEGLLHVHDSRPCAVEPTTTLEGAQREVYLACRRPRTASRFAQSIGAGSRFSPEEIETAVGELIERKLLIQLHGKLLALAMKEPISPLVTKKQFLWGYNIGGKFNVM